MTSSLGAAAANPTQVLENLPSSLVGFASSLPGNATDQKPKYGLSMRFKVRIIELNADLGEWASCQGLRVDFNPVGVLSGGDYLSMHYLPGDMKYPKVVLKRAVEPSGSQLVQDWLANAAKSWITGERENPNPGSAKITLLNAEDEEVITWTLDNVRPASWTGPDLDANSSKVAIETLELVHEGFHVVVHGSERLRPAPRSAPAAPNNLQRFTLTGVTDHCTVEFRFRPEKITVKRSTESTQLGTADGKHVETGDRPDITVLGLGRLIVAGPQTRTDVEQLLTWGTKVGGQTNDHLPKLKLAWGQLNYDVKIKTVDATYTRFDAQGKPLRAEVTLSLYALEPERPGPTNPSSGGFPGRGAHSMLLSDRLPLVATKHYGKAAHWRDIAEANGIDDPLRIRPGTALFLPADTELRRNGGPR